VQQNFRGQIMPQITVFPSILTRRGVFFSYPKPIAFIEEWSIKPT